MEGFGQRSDVIRLGVRSSPVAAMGGGEGCCSWETRRNVIAVMVFWQVLLEAWPKFIYFFFSIIFGFGFIKNIS